MKKAGSLSLACATVFLALVPPPAYAQSAAPEMLGVTEVVVDYVSFADLKTSDSCGLSREHIASTLAKALANTGVPAVAVIDAKPPSLGVARIQLIPEIATYADENLDCVSFISLSAESRVNAVIPPVASLRGVTVVYWRQHTMAASGQSTHEQTVDGVVQKMADQFAQQYRLDQPPELPK